MTKYIFCAGMSRSGSTVQYQLVKAIVERHLGGLGVGFGWQIDHSKPPADLIVIKSEQPRSWMLDECMGKGGLALGIFRDPRDVAVSLAHFFNARNLHLPRVADRGKMEHVLNVELPASMRWYQQWQDLPAAIFYQARYEDVLSIPDGWAVETLAMAEFLGVLLEPEEAQEIAAEYSISRNLERMASQSQWIDAGDSMLTKEHISPRRGAAGQWRLELTDQQVARIEQDHGDWMQKWGYLD